MKQKLILSVVLIVIVLAGVYLMMNLDSKPSTFEVKDGNLVIGGSFGVAVKLGEIKDLALKDAVPEIGTKTNGLGVGTVYKGEFTLKDGQKARLYVDVKNPPFISFTQGDTVYYLNAGTEQETRALHKRIQSGLSR